MDFISTCRIRLIVDLLGVPSLPPKLWGFRHFVQHPLYLEQGRLYHVPNSEAEFSLFHILEKEDEKVTDWPYPRG